MNKSKLIKLIPPFILEKFHKWRIRSFYSQQFLQYMRMNGISDTPAEGEDEYVKKWEVFDKKVERHSYRFYSRYCGQDSNIVPENIFRQYIEPKMNPQRYQGYYGDKNAFELIVPSQYVIPTVLRKMGGGILDADYNAVNHLEEILENRNANLFLKPSVDSSSGKGVLKFSKYNGEYINHKTGEKLTAEFLNGYGSHFILQEAVEQYPYLSQFCKTSINTLRIATYRSVVDEKPHVIGALIRVGKDGEVVDNAHAGGRFVGIDVESGLLGKCAFDQYGRKYDVWNSINYGEDNYTIPNWNSIIESAKDITSHLHHMRLIQLDIAIDKQGCPKLIEYNVTGFSSWLYMTTGRAPFGNFTQEIIDYCIK